MLAKNGILQGRYRIIRQLGYGGMGAVYEAIDERFGEPIALKEIIIGSANDKQKDLIINAFEREAKSLAKAKHEAIPYVRDYFSEDDKQFLVMELVEGEDLAEMLAKSEKPFPLAEVLDWADQLLDALDYLHNLEPSIIHRDIKPHNIKLNFRRKIKLLDFGIAKSGSNKSALTNQTFVGATLDYSPIEQILRVIDPTFREFIILKHKEKAEKVLNQYTDTRCDIYSLGGTFYHLLTNRAPEDATRRTLALWEGKNDPLPGISEINPEVPPLVSECFLKAMEVERDDRFSSASEMRQTLQAAIKEGAKKKEEETVPLIANEYLRIAEERTSKQNLTPAITQKLIPFSLIKDEFTLSDPPAPTEPLIMPTSETQPSAKAVTARESEIQTSDNIPTFEPPENLLFEKIAPNKNNSTFVDFPVPAKEIATQTKNDAKLYLILPIAALFILAITGIAGVIMWSGSSPAKIEKPIIKTINPALAATEEISPTPETKNSPLPVTDNTPVIKSKNVQPPKPTTAPPPPINKTPVKTQPTQVIPAKTPKRVYTDDCIYNRKCN